MPRVNPYEVEPEYTDEELRQMDLNAQNEEINFNQVVNINLDQIMENCRCGNCVPAWLGLGDTEQKLTNFKKYINVKDARGGFICCQQIPEAVNFLETEDELGSAHCITVNADYKAMCLRKPILKATYKSYLHSRRRPAPPANLSNKTYRYTAYRSYTHLVFDKLGRRNRKMLPLCTLLNIRKNFPEENVNLYTSYQPGVEIEGFRLEN